VVCTVQSATDNLIRTAGYTEQVGDVVIACTGGVPTAAGHVVPAVDIQIFLSLNVTSQITTKSSAGNFLDALLIIDEPNSATNPGVQLLNCGATLATNELLGAGQSGPGVCSITAPGAVAGGSINTYNPGAGGGPNVFQGRQALGSLQNTSVVFQGVPFDPPGSITRYLRFTNVRVNANELGVASPTAQIPILMGITASGSASLPLSFLSLAVATAQNGLTVSTNVGPNNFAQCISQNLPTLGAYAVCDDGSGPSTTTDGLVGKSACGESNFSPLTNITGASIVRFSEGFASSWKPKNLAQVIANGTPSSSSGDGFAYDGDTGTATASYGTGDLNQNVPGVNHFTESGFEYYSTSANPGPPNPPLGFQTAPVFGDTSHAFSDSHTGISVAGIATQGTRLALSIANIPGGTALYVPPVLFLYRQGVSDNGAPSLNNGSATGVAVLTATDSNGDTGFNPPTDETDLTLVSQSNGSALVVYEILFTDPFSNEYLAVPVVVSYATQLNMNLPLGLPQPNVTATYQGGFAPFYSASGAFVAASESSYPIPRFFFQAQGGSLFTISRCSCNLLWPFVTQQFGYDTGIAIANTSTDNLGVGGASVATAQEGTVTFNYYGVVGVNGPPPPAQTSSVSTPVASGTVLVYTLSQGNTAIGLDNRGANFTGYLITTAQFQYCHGFAFISALGAGPTSAGISEGYLALVLDAPGLDYRGSPLGEDKIPIRGACSRRPFVLGSGGGHCG